MAGSAKSDERTRSPSGVPLEPWYESPSRDEAPGRFPFTRGIHESMYRGRLWTFRQYAGFASTEETNRRFHYLLERGQTGLSIAFDLPTQTGYDSDDPIALGEVGRAGVPISTVDDLDRLLSRIPLDRASISMTINATAPILIAFLVTLARERDVDPSNLRGTVQNDLLKEFMARRTHRFPVEPSLRLVTDVIEYSSTSLPRFHPISISGYHIREAGSTAVAEVALTLANAKTYFERAGERGVDLEGLGSRASFFWNAHNDLFEEVAKLRAARRLWASIARETFGLSDDACRMRFHTQTAGSTLTFQEPWNNAVRVAYQALAAVLGGTQSLHTNSLDEALGLPSAIAARTALRTQQILAHETGVARVADPLGGCPLIESLTDGLETRIRSLLAEIDAMGGAVVAVENGFAQALIEEEAYRHQRAVERREKIIVGVNGFVEEDEEAGGDVEPTRPQAIDPSHETRRRADLAVYRAARDAKRVDSALADLDAAARGTDNLMPPLLACAAARATLGEMSRVLARVFGEHRSA